MRTLATRPRALRVVAAAALSSVAVGMTVASASAAPSHGTGPASGSCRMSNGITHVVQIQFDNVHLTRDDPNVPSDLEQMPNLLQFLEGNGTVLSDTHDVLVHTATNFLADQTGLYPDRMSVTQSNSGEYFDATGTPQYAPAFGYWTDPLTATPGGDQKYLMDYAADRDAVPTTTNVDAPAPWVPFTRDGCDVGEVGIANTVLENTTSDVATVFGAGSPQAVEASGSPAKAAADVEGLAVHCATSSSLCANGKPDLLPDEPGGYAGHRALFGNAEIQPVVSPSGPVRNLDGAPITDKAGNPGFPGFDSLTPTNALGYAAQLLEHGVDVTNVYVSDAHGDHTTGTGDFGPGEKGYEDQLHAYDAAFGTFLRRLAKDGITPANTLFSVTTDEGDHFSGSAPSPAGCTGLNGNYCTYTTSSEVNVDLPGLLATEKSDTVPFAIHSDPAPALWVNGDPDRTSTTVRELGQDIAGVSFTNPLTGKTEPVAYQLADQVEEKILHFVGPDAARTPTLTAFSGEDTYVTGGNQNCASPCVYTSQGYAWNHGGIWPDMQDIWSAYVGPGVRRGGVDSTTWADQTDMRPTVLALTGLHDDYLGDGRVLVEDLSPSALPAALRAHADAVRRLGELYKQLLGADGRFAEDTLTASTHAVSSPDDGRYTDLENRLVALGHQRNLVADRIRAQLLGAAFDGRPVDQRSAQTLEQQAQQVLDSAHRLAGS